MAIRPKPAPNIKSVEGSGVIETALGVRLILSKPASTSEPFCCDNRLNVVVELEATNVYVLVVHAMLVLRGNRSVAPLIETPATGLALPMKP